jgi:hypothetical protein
MTELQEKIIELRKDNWSYGAIQLKLGNPSKKFIKETLIEFAPEFAGDLTKKSYKQVTRN